MRQEQSALMASRIRIRRYFTWLTIMEELSQRTCKVPAGKALMIPVMEVEKSDKEAPGSSVPGLGQKCKEGSR